MASLYDWSTTAASNASVGSINWAEGQAPSSINDSARYEMADVAKWRDLLGAAKISSGTDTIALTSGLSISAYAQGMMFAFEAGGANTGAATLNVDTVGAKDIKKFHDVALASGDLEAGGIYLVAYEATADNFQLLSAVSNAPLTSYSGITQGTHTIWVPAAAMRPTTSNGCAAVADVETTSGKPDMTVLDFDASSDEHAQFQVAFPKSWNEGTITYRVFWTSTATDTDGVAWGLQGVSVANDATIDASYGTGVVVTDDNISAAEDCLVTSTSSAVTIASAAVDTMTFFRVYRDISDANDDMTEDARLLGIQIFYTINAEDDS